MQPQLVLDPAECDAVVFDMDGVVTDTARVHAAAWSHMFDEYLARRAEARGEPAPSPFSDADYRRTVDGKPRYDGVRSFLGSRGIELPEGDPSDPPERETVCGLGNRKNELFHEHLTRDGVDRFEDAVDLVRRLREAGIRTAVISASRNAREVLAQGGVSDLFETRVDGVVARGLGLAGKPAPDVFAEAARRLDTGPERTAIVEDALAGVAAGRAGGFRWVVGVARGGGAEALREAGATDVVDDLSQIAVGGSAEGAERR